MNIWHKLSIEKKCFTVFIIQCISIILVFLILLDIDTNINFVTLFLYVIFLLFFSMRDLLTKKTFFIFNIFVLLLFLPDNCFNLMQSFNIDYNQLKNYSGENIYGSSGGKSTGSYFVLKKDKKRMYFICSPVSKDNDDCYKELSQYFGYGDSRYGNHISVKYAEIYHFRIIFVMPIIYKEKVIYEIKHNDKIIYGYDYFINKFSQQRKNLLIFVVYLILNSVVFCIFYHWIQKDFVQHSQ
ncbi:MAG: hypothetical protein IJV35_08435 [Neisseriaceae bacterium]|nr:hypothetical protein [Neisseriaceae bacterium]